MSLVLLSNDNSTVEFEGGGNCSSKLMDECFTDSNDNSKKL